MKRVKRPLGGNMTSFHLVSQPFNFKLTLLSNCYHLCTSVSQLTSSCQSEYSGNCPPFGTAMWHCPSLGVRIPANYTKVKGNYHKTSIRMFLITTPSPAMWGIVSVRSMRRCCALLLHPITCTSNIVLHYFMCVTVLRLHTSVQTVAWSSASNPPSGLSAPTEMLRCLFSTPCEHEIDWIVV